MNKAYETYKTVTVDTASQGKLILIAYDVAIKSCKAAIEQFSDYRAIETRTRHLFKAQDAITELMSALRLDVGEIAHNLYRLYDYMLRSLVESNVKNDVTKCAEILRYLESLREAWAVAIDKVNREKAPAQKVEQGFAISG
jgi:flagellar secretion chaperone FliS